MNTGYIVDTHALLWFMTQDKRLSSKAHDILCRVQEGKCEGIIPTIVLAELASIVEKKKARANIDEIIQKINQIPSFLISVFDFKTFEEMRKVSPTLELHDRIIIATARLYRAEVLTKDGAVKKLGEVGVVW